MRGALLIIVLIAMLVVGALVIKDLQSGPEKNADKTEAIKKAEDAAAKANEATQKAAKTIEEAMGKMKSGK